MACWIIAVLLLAHVVVSERVRVSGVWRPSRVKAAREIRVATFVMVLAPMLVRPVQRVRIG